MEDHTAAVKALAWCPFLSNLLASGGGGGDRCIKFWNTHTGACLNSVDTGSQVCASVWNQHERELLSSHGFDQNQLTLWKYPSMVKMAELTGYTSRVLFMAQVPPIFLDEQNFTKQQTTVKMKNIMQCINICSHCGFFALRARMDAQLPKLQETRY